jgi:hypothetical protein
MHAVQGAGVFGGAHEVLPPELEPELEPDPELLEAVPPPLELEEPELLPEPLPLEDPPDDPLEDPLDDPLDPPLLLPESAGASSEASPPAKPPSTFVAPPQWAENANAANRLRRPKGRK